jgi:hypothetical protein
MSLTYQYIPQNAVFELSIQVNIVRNKLCDIKEELDCFKIEDTSHDLAIVPLKTTTNNLQTEIDSIDAQLKALKDELSYSYSVVETKKDIVRFKRREVLQFYYDKTQHNGLAIKTQTNALGNHQQNLLAVDKAEYNVDIGFKLTLIKSTTKIAGDITLKSVNGTNIGHNGYKGRLSTGRGLVLRFASNGNQSSQVLLGYGIQIEYKWEMVINL